ncbi:Tn3 family transposase [Streptosporangium sp. NPDC048047]|uniref:Tn3 family transposase n=1 Tax=Streptosporangium sp. NPDC048047 TaxID=3155748 RepID=UPI0034211EAC
MDLLPRIKQINRVKLHHAGYGDLARYANLAPAMTRPVRWDIIAKNHDQVVKYATAIRIRTSSTEAILSRSTRTASHPAYQAMLEIGPYRTLQRWLADCRRDGLTGLARRPRRDAGRRRRPRDMQLLIEGLGLQHLPPSIATIHRQGAVVAAEQGWPTPRYATTYAVVSALDPALARWLRMARAVIGSGMSWCIAGRRASPPDLAGRPHAV